MATKFSLTAAALAVAATLGLSSTANAATTDVMVLDGAGSDDDLRAQVDDLWDRLAVERADELAAETP